MKKLPIINIKGPRGEKGDKPAHEWQGTSIRFEKQDGTWESFKNLKGDPGGVADAPDDGRQYARKNAGWSEVAIPAKISQLQNDAGFIVPAGEPSQVLNGQGSPITPTAIPAENSTIPFSAGGAFAELVKKSDKIKNLYNTTGTQSEVSVILTKIDNAVDKAVFLITLASDTNNASFTFMVDRKIFSDENVDYYIYTPSVFGAGEVRVFGLRARKSNINFYFQSYWAPGPFIGSYLKRIDVMYKEEV